MHLLDLTALTPFYAAAPVAAAVDDDAAACPKTVAAAPIETSYSLSPSLSMNLLKLAAWAWSART